MISFRLDKKKLDRILPLCGTYVDVVYFNNKVILASEDGVCYCQIMFDAFSEDANQKRVGFRIETGILKRLAVNGRVGIRFADSSVELSMFGEGEEVIYKSFTPMMNSFLEFGLVTNLVNRFNDYDYHHVTQESSIIKLASKFNDVFVSEGRFCYVFHNNSYVFAKSDLGDFCVDGKYFKNVTSMFERFKLIDNFIVFIEENIFIYLKRNKMPILSDLEYIVSSKAICRLSMNFKRGNYLVNSLGAENYKATLNVTAGKLFIETSKGKFEAKIDLLEEKKKELTMEEKLKALSSPSVNNRVLRDRMIRIPKWVFGVISDYSNLTFFVKKNTCLVQFGTSYVVFQGGFISEN